MKKLSLTKLNVSNDDLISRDEQKRIAGGYDGFYCAYVYSECDYKYPRFYEFFSQCMTTHGC